jgi:hypothetical protein
MQVLAMVKMLKPGTVISYRVRMQANNPAGTLVGTAPIVRNIRNGQDALRCHYVVIHEGRELDVYLDEVTL